MDIKSFLAILSFLRAVYCIHLLVYLILAAYNSLNQAKSSTQHTFATVQGMIYWRS